MGHTFGSNAYKPTRFALAMHSQDKRPPRASITIANVGMEFTEVAEDSRGGRGVTLVGEEWLWNGEDADPDATAALSWRQGFFVAAIDIDAERASIELALDPAEERRAVSVRHDPDHAPALFY